MSFLVVKDAEGVVVAWGPDDEHYAPGIPDGGSTEVVEDPPVLVAHEAAPMDPVAKLKAFLDANPDVKALVV